MINTKQSLYKLRKLILSKVIPEFFWPKTVDLNGVEIKIRNMPYSTGVKWALYRKTYEANERKLIEKNVSLNDIVFEFGGSIGVITSLLLKKVGPLGFVAVVEASQKLYKILVQNYGQNNNLKIFNGMGIPVDTAPPNSSNLSFIETGSSMGAYFSFSEEKTVAPSINPLKQYDLKTLCHLTGKKPTGLVVDIEGSEILLKSGKIMDSVRYLIMEMHPGIYGADVERDIIKSLREDNGFSLVECSNHNGFFSR